MPPSVARVLAAYRLLQFAASPSYGGSLTEVGSARGAVDAPIPDQARASVRSYQRRVDKRLSDLAEEIVFRLQNPTWRPPKRWYCGTCHRLRPAEHPFCHACGHPRPAEAPPNKS